jgi:putative pyruvate formate lyase activating enzyme
MCLSLQNEGAENVNLVTGTHFIPSIALGLDEARAGGLSIPVLGNSSGSTRSAPWKRCIPIISVYLPDLKTLDPASHPSSSARPSIHVHAAESLLFLADERPLEIVDGVIRRGVIVRQLVLPGYLGSTRTVLNGSPRISREGHSLSVMSQYTPLDCGKANPHSPSPGRKLSESEYETVLRWLDEIGIEDGFIQDLYTGEEWLPDFTRRNPFPSELSRPCGVP